MKSIITVKDIPNLIGKFIVQLDERHTDPCMAKKFRENPGFWLEKRISFVSTIYGRDAMPHIKVDDNKKDSLIVLNGFYYCHGMFTYDPFVRYFNHYLSRSCITEEDIAARKDTRYHRLLTNAEMDWLNEQIKK